MARPGKFVTLLLYTLARKRVPLVGNPTDQEGCFLKALVGTQQRPDTEMAVEVELEGSSTCSNCCHHEKENGGRPPSPPSIFLRSRLGAKKCKDLKSTLQVHDESSDDPAQTTRPITCNDIDAIEFRDDKSSNVLKNYLER